MRNTLCTITALTLALMSLDGYGQGLPRSRGRGTRGDARTDDNRSPSMSRVRPSSSSPRRPRGDSSRSKRPAGKPSALRPGIGAVPSGTRRRDGGKISDFLQLSISRGTLVVRTRIVRTPVVRKPVVRKPVVRKPIGRKPVGRTPVVRTPVVRRPVARKPIVRTPVVRRPVVRRPVVRKPVVRRPPVYRTVQPVRRTGYKPPRYRPRWGHKAPFTLSWYKTRPALPKHYRPPVYHPWHRRHPRYKPSHWWAWATMKTLTTWMRRRWSRPAYYVYGTNGNVYYYDGFVYVGGTRYASAADYFRQALALALGAPRFDDAAAPTVQWLPLGVFAFMPAGVSQTNSYFQLAVTRDGVIGGTYVNQATNTTRPVEGTVDKDTQRAAWTFADGKNTDIVFETSIYNLTENQAPVLVHFGATKTQEGTLVRMEAPQDG